MPRAPERRYSRAVFALCALLLALAAGPAAAEAAKLGGVNIEIGSQPGEAEREIALARSLHANVVRLEMPWSALEPQGPGRIDAHALSLADRAMADAAAAGIRLILTVRSTPCWASSAPPPLLGRCAPARTSAANAWPPRDPSSYAAFVAYLAARYGARLAAIELWNEPDQANQLYFAGPDKARRYAALVRAAYPAIKHANAQVPVLAGSLVGSNGVFLRALYAAGMKGFYDGLAVHFYNLTLASLRSIRQVQLESGDSKPLWLDEFGWSSCWPARRIEAEQPCVTAPIQALNFANVLRSLARTPYVAATVIFKLRDSAQDEFGLVSASGQHKRAFAAVAAALAGRPGRVSAVKLALARRRGRVLASGSAPVGDFMELEAFQRGVLRYRALFVLDRFNRYSITLPRVLGTSGLRVRVFAYGTGPSRGAQRSI